MKKNSKPKRTRNHYRTRRLLTLCNKGKHDDLTTKNSRVVRINKEEWVLTNEESDVYYDNKEHVKELLKNCRAVRLHNQPLFPSWLEKKDALALQNVCLQGRLLPEELHNLPFVLEYHRAWNAYSSSPLAVEIGGVSLRCAA